MVMLSEAERRALADAFTDEKTEELPLEEILAEGEPSVEVGKMDQVSGRIV